MIVTIFILLNSNIIRIEASYDRIILKLMDIIHKKKKSLYILFFFSILGYSITFSTIGDITIGGSDIVIALK